MKSFVFVCFLVCVIQAFGQVIGFPNGLPIPNGLGPGLPGACGPGIGPANNLAGLPISAVSPIGYGDVAVTGELPVGGSTAVVGNVPIIGFVTFEGILPAGGTVALANCGCNPVL